MQGFGCKLHKNPDRTIDEWGTDIEAACAETAVAKVNNIYHAYTMTTFKNPDVGEYEVKHSPRLDYNLILSGTILDDDIFYLVLGMAPKMRVIGWLKGKDVKQPKYWREDMQAYIAPQKDLIPVGPPIPLKSWEIDGPDKWSPGDPSF